MNAGVCGGEVVHAESNHLPVGGWSAEQVAGEDLVAGFAEVLGQEGVEDGVDAGVSIGQAVGDDPESKGGVVEREGAELRPHGDDVVRHPADGEAGDDQEDGLRRLRKRKHHAEAGGCEHKPCIKIRGRFCYRTGFCWKTGLFGLIGLIQSVRIISA